MEQNLFDNVSFEKGKAIARFNSLRRIGKLCRIMELVMVLGLISWSTSRVPTVMRVSGGYFVDFAARLFNHHVVFLIGNAIIVSLFMLCRQNNAESPHGAVDFYEDYIKHSEAVVQPTTLFPTETEVPRGDDEEKKKIVVVAEDEDEEVMVIPQCDDDVTAAIDQATRRIKRFQRTQSAKLKQDILVKPPRPELRRSQTGNCRQRVKSGDDAAIEALSNEEFRRTVDAFIDKHWKGNNKKKIMN